jgi:nitric oxide reductase
LDGAEHERQRALLERDFTAAAVEKKWRPIMERVVDGVLDEMMEINAKAKVNQQPVDFVAEFATPVPTRIIYQVLGIPESDVERLSADSEVRNSTSRNAAETANSRLQGYISELVHSKMSHATASDDKDGHKDIIGGLIAHRHQGKLSEAEISALAFLLLTAGNAALISSISVGVLLLLEHPDQVEKFRADPLSLASKAVTEICRYHTASALNSRRAVLSDLQIGGQTFHAGKGVICAVQSADRDERKFGADAESFNILRETKFGDVLGFGYGAHRCLADIFSKMQLEIALGKSFQRCPGLRLAGEGDGDVEFTPERMNAGITRMMVFVE